MLGKIKKLDICNNKTEITLIINENIEELEELKDLDLDILIKKYKPKRSLDANAYCWTLIQKIADKLNLSKLEVYKKAIKEVGVYEIIPIKNEAVERFLETWQKNGIGWVCEKQASKLKGYTNIWAFYGSSSYNSKEMAVLIDNIIQDCKAIGIETKSPAEIQSLKESWF